MSETAPSRQMVNRVFVSFPSELAAEAAILSERLRARGVMNASSTSDTTNAAFPSEAAAIEAANIFVVLVATNVPIGRQQQFETSQMLEAAWSSPHVRIAAVAPAVGAIPPGLRHGKFLWYFPQDQVRFDQWTSVPETVDVFLDELLAASDTMPPGTARMLSDDEVRLWRNRIVHIGREGEDPIDGPTRRDLITSLQEDLARFVQTEPSQADANLIEALLERTLLSEALNEEDLAAVYYSFLQGQMTQAGASSGSPTADRSYAAGLAALGARDYSAAFEHLQRAIQVNEETRESGDARSVAALYNAALTASLLGRNEKARELYRRALLGARQGLGVHHPQTAAIASNLAAILSQSGSPAEAISLLRLAEEAYETTEPRDSPHLKATRDALRRLGA